MNRPGIRHDGNVRGLSRLLLPALLLAALAARPAAVNAHPSIDDQLSVLQRHTARDPCNAAALLKQGDLRRVRHEWTLAQAAYDHAAACDPHLDLVDFARGELSLEAGAPHTAMVFFDRYLGKHPDAANALLARGRTLMDLGRAAQAVADFDRAIASLPAAQPDHYLERARAQIAAGRPDDAVRGLDAGLNRLGPVPALQQMVVDLEVQQGRYDTALQRLETLTAYAANREAWLIRRAELLERTGRFGEARADFAAALAALAARPPHRRATPALRELEDRARAGANRLASNSPAGRE